MRLAFSARLNKIYHQVFWPMVRLTVTLSIIFSTPMPAAQAAPSDSPVQHPAGDMQAQAETPTPTPTTEPTQTSTPPTCLQSPAGLVSWWAGEGNADDRVGTNQGALQNGVTFATGLVDQAFNFDGTSGYVTVPDNASLRPVNALSVDAWIKPVAPLNPSAPIVKKPGAGDNSGYALEFSGNNLVFWVYINGQGWRPSASGSITLDEWSHVAGIYDGATISLYLNGNLVGSPTSAPGGIATSNEELNIGHDPINTNRFYHGLIDEVGLFDRALSALEIQSIYLAGSAGQCKPTAMPTETATPSLTPSPTASATDTPTATSTPTPTTPPSATATITPTLSLTSTPPPDGNSYSFSNPNFFKYFLHLLCGFHSHLVNYQRHLTDSLGG